MQNTATGRPVPGDPPEAGWEQFDVDADVGVRAWGPTRAEAFAQAALGVFALIVAPDEVEEREHREVRAQAESPETLLVTWINECLYVHEIEGFVVHRVAVLDRKSTRLNSSHSQISYAVFCLKKKKKQRNQHTTDQLR